MGFCCDNLSMIYQPGVKNIRSIQEATFRVEDNEFVCIVGPSGCGKTTLLKLIAGLLAPTSGEVVFDQNASTEHSLTAMVFQEQGLFPWLKVWENVAFGLEMQGMGKEERKNRAEGIIGDFGLKGFSENYPHELSGGMKQRVALARAFLTDPMILLMDEPFGSLDAQTKLVLQTELLHIWKEHKKTVVYVTHDIEEAILLGDRILVMTGRPGRIREEIVVPLGRPREISPQTQAEILEMKWTIWKMLEDEVRRSLQAETT